jgi:uncharacterized protein involved in exopolysaccharide biosynthesis/Mrp family chromosome partitioning ATPase
VCEKHVPSGSNYQDPPQHNKAREGARTNGREEVVDHSDMVQQVLAILKRRKKYIMAVAAGAGLLASIVAVTTTPSYLAKALLVLDLRGHQVESSRDSGSANIVSTAIQEAALETHITSLLSETNLRRALESLPELKDAKGELTRPSSPPRTFAFLHALLDWVVDMRTAVGDYIRNMGNDAGAGPRSADLVRLIRNLRIDQERRSNVIGIGYWSPDPKDAARVANTIARVYVEDLSAQMGENAKRELAWVTKRIEQVKKEATQADTDVQVFRQLHALPESAGSDEIQQQIVETAKQLALLKTNAANSRARQSGFSKARKANRDLRELAKISGSGVLTELARRESALMGSQRQEDQPQLADIRSAIERELDAAESNLEAEVRGADSQVLQGERKLQLLQQAAQEGVGNQAESRLLERKAAALSQLYDDLLRRREALAEHAQTPTPDIRIMAEAWPPNRPASISGFFIVPPIMIGSALLACFLVIVRDRFRNALYREAEVEDALHVPCVGVIPELHPSKSEKIETVLFDDSHSHYLKAIRGVLIPTILRQRGAREPKVILVTSAQAADGKSMFARSIAIVTAHTSRRVLLVGFDAVPLPPPRDGIDPEKPKSTPASSGREHILTAVRSMLSAVKPADRHGIDCLSLCRDDLFELLGSDQIAQSIGKLRDIYEFIIVDAPSVLEAPEACMLAGVADEVFFLVRWGETNRVIAHRAITCVQAATGTGSSLQLFAVLTRSSCKSREDKQG